MSNIHQRFTERIELARVYAEDGAFYTAAKILSELAAEMKAHAIACDPLTETHEEYGERRRREKSCAKRRAVPL